MLNLNQHVATFNLERIHGDLHAGIVRSLARLRIPLPAVPWADQLVAFDHSLPQGPAAVQAYVVHSADGAVDVGDTDYFVAAGKFFFLPFGVGLGWGCESGEIGHVCPRTLSI